jgi:hypothetical protein
VFKVLEKKLIIPQEDLVANRAMHAISKISPTRLEKIVIKPAFKDFLFI